MVKINVYMKKLIERLKKLLKGSSGFTLIELLVVIGILGVLAAALIATIDPFEQIKKANDTNSKNTAVEFVNANIRYYTTHSSLPWATGQVPSCSSVATSTTGLGDASAKNCINGLIAEGELKSAFNNAAAVLSTITYTGNATSVIACFKPTSKSQQEDINTIYALSGAVTTGCKSQTPGVSGTDCYWCAQ